MLHTDVVDLFCQMARIDSESGAEQKFMGWVGRFLAEELSAEVALDAFGNLVAHIPCLGASFGSTSMILAAHADTVCPGIGIEPVVDDGVLRSRGDTILGADDKAGIAEILVSLMEAARRPPIDVVLTVQEERGLQGSRNLDLGLLRGREAFVLDGEAVDEIVIGGPTRFTFDIGIHGVSAHAGMEPEKGLSAIHVAAQALIRAPQGRVDAETTVNFGTIRGGTGRNSVPDHVLLEAECRSLNHEEAERQASRIREAFEATCGESGARLEFERTTQYRAARLPKGSPIVERASSAARAVGLQPSVKAICGGTDALILMSRDIPAVTLGTGVQAAHSPREHIAIDDMVLATRMLIALMEGYCASDRATR